MQTAPIKPLKPWFRTVADMEEEYGIPLQWSDVFGNDNPVELDIGSGRGLFVYTASGACPDRNFVGIETDFREGRRAAMRLKKRDQKNAFIVGGDCRVFLQKNIPPACASAAHVYFPDPWWKSRHHKRRLFTPDFIDLLARVVRPGGEVHSWTDVIEYYDVIRDLLDNHPEFEVREPDPEKPAEHDMDYRTSFERKKRKLGLPIYRGLWRRR